MMRRAGQVGCLILGKMKQAAVAGVTTGELDDLAADELRKVGGVALSKNYPTYKPGEGFPGNTCISVNDEAVHGIPGRRRLRRQRRGEENDEGGKRGDRSGHGWLLGAFDAVAGDGFAEPNRKL
jgi:methionine aminopeptidase